MSTYLLTQMEFLLRLIVAGICGSLVGYERKKEQIERSPDVISFIQEKFNNDHIQVINLKIERIQNESLYAEFFVRLLHNYDVVEFMNLFKNNIHIHSVEY